MLLRVEEEPCTLGSLFCSVLFCEELMAQGVWSAPIVHQPNGPQVHPASDSIANPSRWITEAAWNASTQTVTIPTPGTRFNTIHTSLIPSGPFRGCVLVIDGNHRLVGTRFYQPWAIFDPYWPNPNPFVAGGGSGYRFHNATLAMPLLPSGLPEGELFCSGHRWTADGRLFLAGGTAVYPPAGPTYPATVPPNNTGMYEMWYGTKFVYQWDPTPTPGNSTNLVMPGTVGQINTRIARIGGARVTATGAGPTNRVESVVAGAGPAFWSSGTPGDVPNMQTAREVGNVVVLPTGWLFAVGGNNAAGAPNLAPEVLPEGASSWRVVLPHQSPRNYHSCALLLPDARVLVCGADQRTSDYEIWEPMYLQVAANRRPAGVAVVDAATASPISQTLLGAVTYGQECSATWSNTLAAGVEISQAVLVAPESVTHHDDGGQRLVRLMTYFDSDATPPYTQVRFKMPPNFRHAPPGWYMLFLITNEGVPSMAFWVNLR